jgi:hypothetical protein
MFYIYVHIKNYSSKNCLKADRKDKKWVLLSNWQRETIKSWRSLVEETFLGRLEFKV